MLKNKFKYILSFSILFLVGCNSYPETPEEVVEQYVEYLSNGECNKAKEFCYGRNTLGVLDGLIESGCETYTVIIDSIDCEIRDTNCICMSYENRATIGTLTIPYSLVLIDNEWKINDISKDAGPWSWVDYDANEFYDMENGEDGKYQNPIKTIDLIFSNYIKYDKSIESEDDREAMTTCLKQLGPKLTVEELAIILNVWMYYNPIDFPRKELTESIFKRNRKNSKIAIEERINQKFDWEDENIGSYGELANLLKMIHSEIKKSQTSKPITKSDEVNTMIYFNTTMDTVSIEYSGQCIYEYPIQQKNDSIYVYFDTLEDCVYRSGVKEFYNLPQNEYPKIGDLFLVMKIDSIRSYNRFLFPRWVDSVNSIRNNQNVFTAEFIVPNY